MAGSPLSSSNHAPRPAVVRRRRNAAGKPRAARNRDCSSGSQNRPAIAAPRHSRANEESRQSVVAQPSAIAVPIMAACGRAVTPVDSAGRPRRRTIHSSQTKISSRMIDPRQPKRQEKHPMRLGHGTAEILPVFKRSTQRANICRKHGKSCGDPAEQDTPAAYPAPTSRRYPHTDPALR